MSLIINDKQYLGVFLPFNHFTNIVLSIWCYIFHLAPKLPPHCQSVSAKFYHFVIYCLICLQTVDCYVMKVAITVAVLLDSILEAVGIKGCLKFSARLNMMN